MAGISRHPRSGVLLSVLVLVRPVRKLWTCPVHPGPTVWDSATRFSVAYPRDFSEDPAVVAVPAHIRADAGRQASHAQAEAGRAERPDSIGCWDWLSSNRMR
jgi:hypothetical protein